MRWTALTLLFAAGVLGCGARETSGRPRLWTLFDMARLAPTGGFAAGVPASYFLTSYEEGGVATGRYDLTVSSGFVDGQPMKYVTTELWANFDRVWVQPLYIASGDNDQVREPWVFGFGPESLFYSPFWQVFRFDVPSDVNVETLRDTRAVLEAANRTGGLRRAERRITSLAPASVFPARDGTHYHDDTAAWDGVWGRRYLDAGPGRFDVDSAGVVREIPIFAFMKRDDNGVLRPTGAPNVGGTRPLFSAPPALTNSRDGGTNDDAGMPPALPPVDLNPNFGGLWRVHTVELPNDATETDPDRRVLLHASCLSQPPCVVLDSQTAIESLGAERIVRTELSASCPILRIGNLNLPDPPINPPMPLPSTSLASQ